jgi:hypothetical protein
MLFTYNHIIYIKNDNTKIFTKQNILKINKRGYILKIQRNKLFPLY